MESNTLIGWTVGLVMFFGLGVFVPDPTCRDGWKSESIGKRGACSHHGGVKESPWTSVVFILSIAGGIFITNRLNKRDYPDPEEQEEPETPYGTLQEYEAHLRKLGIGEDQIEIELNKYKKT